MFQHSARCLNIPHQIDFSCRKIVFPTAKSVLEFQNFFCHRMLKDFTTNRFFLQKNRFSYNKIRFGIPKCFLSQNVERFHTKSIFSAEKSFFLQQNPFWKFQNVFFRRMLKDFTTNRFFLQKNRFSYNKIRFGIPKCFFSQNVERFHNKSIFPVPTSFLV